MSFVCASSGLKRPRGVLMIEGVVAAFLMVFAFAAATALFDASLKWETQGSNTRRAALVAEKALGELRAWSLTTHSNSNFDAGWSSRTGVRPEYPEAPGFQVEVIADQPVHGQNPTTGHTPPPGVYSPASHLWMPPNDPVADPRPSDPLPPLPVDFENPQRDKQYGTFARVRSFPKSFRRVQIVVRWDVPQKEYRLVSLVGDPITPITKQVTFNRTAGPSSLSAGQAADYSVSLRDAGGHVIEDVVCVWGVDPLGTGALVVKPIDSNGRTARVWRDDNAQSGSTRLMVRLRYRGEEFTGYSNPISVL